MKINRCCFVNVAWVAVLSVSGFAFGAESAPAIKANAAGPLKFRVQQLRLDNNEGCAVADYKTKLQTTDIIVSSKHLAGEMSPGEGKFVLGVQNMLNPNSFGDELLGIIKNNFAN